MNALPPLPSLVSVIRDYGLMPRKALGQNFLADPQLLEKIARQALPLEAETVVEIGPGPGGLTRALLALQPKRMLVIEKDARCIAALQALQQHYRQLEICHADALQIPEAALGYPPFILVGNLPYNVATPILLGWLGRIAENPILVRRMVLMFQKEVGDRIQAGPGSKSYGRLSILSQWLCEVRRVFDIGPAAFYPPPKVTSSVLLLTPRQNIAEGFSKADLEQLTQAAFGQRRKQLRRALQGLASTINLSSEDWLESCGIMPDKRAETVPLEGYFQLARKLSEQKAHQRHNG